MDALHKRTMVNMISPWGTDPAESKISAVLFGLKRAECRQWCRFEFEEPTALLLMA
jgi:hypothetical protein